MTKRSNQEGSITKRSDGRYMGRIQIDRQRYVVYGKTKKEICLKLDELKMRHNAGVEIAPQNYTIAEWAQKWLYDYIKLQVRPNTFLNHITYVNNHILPTLGNLPLSKVNTPDIQRLVREKLDQGLSPVTVRKIRNALHSILQYAVQSNLILRNPAKLVAIKNVQTKEISVLSLEQVQALLSAAKPHRLYPAIFLLVTTGLRRSELCGLKWSDIEWERHALTVRRSVVKYGGYGYLVSNTKTKNSQRFIPLTPTALSLLKEKLSRSGISDYDTFIFSRPDGQPIYPESIYDYLKRLGKKIGIPSITVHMLRHTVATLLLQAGEHPKVVQELLGHSSVSITLDIYTHAIPGMKEQAVNKLSGLISDGVKNGVKPLKTTPG